ncbi:ABC transporter substrate-binding protein [Haliangium sp.]|uniref:ABC transporter substrate-binding protein n=1 Tax=Haliangium sp. TaxID=2663208 RepID=UPI003D0C875E
MAAQRHLLGPALSLALALAAAGPGAAETLPGYGGRIRATLLGEPVHLDPIAARTHAEVTVIGLVFDTLYELDGRDSSGRARVVPRLAAAAPIPAEDGLSVRIPLRAGLRFHDGRPVGADDVVASLTRLRAGDAGWVISAVRSAERVGDAELRLRLTWPMPPDALALALTAPTTAITPRGQPPQAGAPIGSGPFRVERVERKRGRLLLTAHDDHLAGRPYVDAVELSWFEGGNREAAAYEIGALTLSQRGAVAYPDHHPKYETREAAGPATVLVYVGVGRRGPLTSRAARRALSLALERDGLRGIGTGERVVPAEQPVPAAIGGAPLARSARRARMDEARRALAQAVRDDPRLAELSGPGHDRVVEILVDRSRPDDREIAEKVAAALFRLGVAARITAEPAPAFARRVGRGDGDLYIGQLVLPAPAPALAWAAAFAAGADDWAATRLARGPLDLAAAARAFAARLPIVPLAHRAVRVHHRSDLRGVALDDSARLPFADLFFFGRPVPHR